MAKSAMIRARIEPELKEEAETIFSELGLSTTEAITLFYRQVKLVKGLPFEVRVPNQTTLQTFQDTDEGRNLVQSENAQEMFDKLGL
ncbi:MAG: type II toxin-antitoxin system RelB/DinJ family antitoxin [Anaerolineae bacterium]|nr:type II toxin-antitoxin system RelB/DinJ family antitoxin [Anaerolineales bacterium]MCL4300391.1 type II toxin-antitoxin system RelB/DinJ family antitoxin [Anaerolineae bacterium]